MRLISLIILLSCFSCTQGLEPYTTYLNHNDTVKYLGKESCMACHYEIYQSYIQTGMGKSFSEANPMNSQGQFSSFITDTFLNYHYYPYFHDSVLKLKEFHDYNQREEIVDYIIGSGHHTNSHLWHENDYIHQMPFTFYTQENKLDFPPGFENGYNSRFSRPIGLECMSCHNALPDFVLGSENKYTSVPLGIDCERCHGPGELHVKQVSSGQIIDTSKYIDYTIVNPKKLSLEAQFQICMRCHLQGNTVLSEGKSFLDFKPGMELSEIMTVFVPRYEDDNSFIMASHVDRFKQSACFKNSQMNCITCHNPHHSVKKEEPNFFNNKCLSCHDDCKDEFRPNNNCIECHMPASTTIDIPHVSIHDHNIAVHDKKDSLSTKGSFIGLEAVNNRNPSLLIRAKAYLYQYEKFDAQDYMLDSAYLILQKVDLESSFQDYIHWAYLKKEYTTIFNISQSIDGILDKLHRPSYSNTHAWTAHRIAVAFEQLNIESAVLFYQKAVKLAPYVLNFRLKLADYYTTNQQWQNAEQEYRFILKEFSKNENAWCNLGYVLVQNKRFDEALECYQKALSLNPRHLQSLINTASLYIYEGNIKQGKLYLERILKIDPTNKQVKPLIRSING